MYVCVPRAYLPVFTVYARKTDKNKEDFSYFYTKYILLAPSVLLKEIRNVLHIHVSSYSSKNVLLLFFLL